MSIGVTRMLPPSWGAARHVEAVAALARQAEIDVAGAAGVLLQIARQQGLYAADAARRACHR